MAKTYRYLVKKLDTALLGLIAGIVSGIAINIATGESLTIKAFIAILFILSSVAFIIRIIQVRQEIDEAYQSRKGLPLEDNDRWDVSIDYENIKRQKKFFWGITMALTFLITGVGAVIWSNLESDKIKKDFEAIQTHEKFLKDSVNLLTIQTMKQQLEIMELKHAINNIKISQTNVRLKKPKRK